MGVIRTLRSQLNSSNGFPLKYLIILASPSNRSPCSFILIAKALTMAENHWNTKSRQARTGYNLHTARFLYSGKSGIRSFKFPLVADRESEVAFNVLADKIQSDYINQVGLVNFADWKECDDADQESYSLADFWLDSLRAGVIFASSYNEMNEFLGFYNSGQNKLNEFIKKFKEANLTDQSLIDAGKFYDGIILGTGIRKTAGKSTSEVFVKSFMKNYIIPDKRESKEAYELTKRIADGAFGKSKLEQSKFWLEFTGYQVTFTQEEKKRAKGYSKRYIFLPDIKFTPDVDSKSLLLDKYRPWYEEKFGEPVVSDNGKVADKFLELLGLGQQYNAFSEYFHIQNLDELVNNSNKIADEIYLSVPSWTKKKEDLLERLNWLAVRAKKLQTTQLAAPDKYRSSLGGKFSSWVSNTFRQEGEIKDDLFGYIEKNYDKKTKAEKERYHNGHIDILRIVQTDSILSDDDLSESIKENTKLCSDLIEKMQLGVNDADLAIYRRLLGDLRISLSQKYQNVYPEITGKNEKERKKYASEHRADKKYGEIYKDIKLIPNFLGETKREKYKKFIKAATQLKQGISFIESIDAQLKNAPVTLRFKHMVETSDFTLKQLDVLRRKYETLNSSRFRHVLDSIFDGFEMTKDGKSFSLTNLFTDENKDRYAFRRNPFARQDQIIIDLNIPEEELTKNLLSLAQKLKPRWQEILSSGDIGELLDACEMEKVRLGIVIALYHSADIAIDRGLLSSDIFEAAYSFLALKGNLKTLNGAVLGSFLQTSILAEIKGALNKLSRTNYTERYVAQPMQIEQNYPLCLEPEKGTWHIALKKNSEDGIKLLCKTGKDFVGQDDFDSATIDPGELLSIRTSKYHLQFLSKTFNGRQSWWNKKGVNLGLNEYSFILEQDIKLIWGIKKESLAIIRGARKLFVSIPFSIQATAVKSDWTARKRYMGIDVGEYGLAWTILEGDTARQAVAKILARGFIHEPLTHKIREFVQTLKNKQVRGTFSMPSTKLQRLRENAVTSLRNQVHNLAIRYHAIPVYESSITNFETGSNRVKVIYDSVKRADVGAGSNKTAVENLEAELVWGKRTKNFGRQTGSYATSYICSQCGYSPYQEKDEKVKKENLSASRPPEKVLKDLKVPDLWLKRRGNRAIYICKKCTNKSDADIQASYWIALKGFCRDRRKSSGDDTEVTIEDMVLVHQKNPTIISLDFNKL